jgi:hypothetical protein
MDRAAIQTQLARADEAIMKGEQQLARQRQLIEDLRRDGHRTTEASGVLEKWEATQAQLIVERAMLQAQADD